jgi:hypothetical protein
MCEIVVILSVKEGWEVLEGSVTAREEETEEEVGGILVAFAPAPTLLFRFRFRSAEGTKAMDVPAVPKLLMTDAGRFSDEVDMEASF